MEPLRLLHRCKNCSFRFRIRIDKLSSSFFKASCPQCHGVAHIHLPSTDRKEDGFEGTLSEGSSSADKASFSSPVAHKEKFSSDDSFGLDRIKENLEKPKEPVRGIGSMGTTAPETSSFSREPLSDLYRQDYPKGIHEKGSKNTKRKPYTAKSYTDKSRDFASSFTSKQKSSFFEDPFTKLQRIFSLRNMVFLIGISFVSCLCFLGILIASLRFPSLYLPQELAFYLNRLERQKPNLVLDRNGELIAELFSVKNSNLKSNQLPLGIKKTAIFVEDSHFYEHKGIHWPSVLRASLANLFARRYSQGASTITQQLARILLWDRRKLILRKLKEVSLAYYLEKNFSKEEILSYWLNLVYLGHGSYGVQNAAQFYFHKDVKELDFFEELMIVCLFSAPEFYSPLRHPQRLQVKMNLVFQRMISESYELALNNQKDYLQVSRKILFGMNQSPFSGVYGNRIDHAPYVTQYIRQKIESLLGKEYVHNAGLRIKTSIDLKLQKNSSLQSIKFLKEQAPFYPPVTIQDGKIIAQSLQDKIFNELSDSELALIFMGLSHHSPETNRLQTASIGIENKTGKILFMQGGARFHTQNQFNRSIQMYRQTGSAIKPVLYAIALEKGVISTSSLLEDRPVYQRVSEIPNRSYWLPRNYSGIYEGQVSVRRALSFSQNMPALQVLSILGIKHVKKGFGRFFFPKTKILEQRFREDDTVAIGSLEMSPLELALAYSAFGNNGKIQRPYLILSIEDSNGQELYRSKDKDELELHIPSVRKVISGDTAEIMVSLLRSSSHRSGMSRSFVRKKNLVGKTGTSNDYRDSWFAGLTPEITSVVWVGYDTSSFSMNYGTGSKLAAPLCQRIMQEISSSSRFAFHPRARKAKICPSTGRIYTSSCPSTASIELFRRNQNLRKIPRTKKKIRPFRSESSDKTHTWNSSSDFE